MRGPTEEEIGDATLRLRVNVGGLYRHYKTKEVYRVITIAKNTETLEDMVVYETHSYKSQLSNVWTRPIKMFLDTAIVDGETVLRFTPVEEN